MKSPMALALFLLFCLAVGANADWWDDFVEGVHDKITKAANWIRDKAAPAVREKFDDAKRTLQDPETHEKVQDWVQDEALPVVKQKFEQFKSFINEDVVPEVQKIVEAGKEAHKRKEAEQEHVKKSEDE